ncbi:hypothetical protein JK361_37530 [Streptomyces sp. 5-8]|uniref:XRE family transcriptional regulator n=1 Tax=Streptomyces musisoli TaxID=2802280 RepID=A0ABS1PCU1_9ACTN|nr:hypothetical protein [Streptomyces musisoli]MBL1110193.1 hypothetical protein [Streptomyces musisoli]
MDQRALALKELRTAADLNAELRELKARSRLTYRQLEERAAGQGGLLPRSTLADVLRHGSLPRQELLTAFVRACGEGDYVDDWLAARKRAAESQTPGQGPGGSGPGAGGWGHRPGGSGQGSEGSAGMGGSGEMGRSAGMGGSGEMGRSAGAGGAGGPGGPGATGGSRDSGESGESGGQGESGGRGDSGGHGAPDGPEESGGRGGRLGPPGARGALRRLVRTRRSRVLAGTVLAAALAAGVVWFLRDSGPGGTADPAAGSTPLPRGQVLLRPLASPGLCVTDGQARDGRYRSLVAVQRPCAETAPQTTTLEPVDKGTYRISWYRPDQGKGCLKALTSGPGEGLLEPWEACEQTTVFHFVPTEHAKAAQAGTSGKSVGRPYLIKVDDGTCVGIRAASPAAGAEAVVEGCTGADSQLFLVEAAL